MNAAKVDTQSATDRVPALERRERTMVNAVMPKHGRRRRVAELFLDPIVTPSTSTVIAVCTEKKGREEKRREEKREKESEKQEMTEFKKMKL